MSLHQLVIVCDQYQSVLLYHFYCTIQKNPRCRLKVQITISNFILHPSSLTISKASLLIDCRWIQLQACYQSNFSKVATRCVGLLVNFHHRAPIALILPAYTKFVAHFKLFLCSIEDQKWKLSLCTENFLECSSLTQTQLHLFASNEILQWSLSMRAHKCSDRHQLLKLSLQSHPKICPYSNYSAVQLEGDRLFVASSSTQRPKQAYKVPIIDHGGPSKASQLVNETARSSSIQDQSPYLHQG